MYDHEKHDQFMERLKKTFPKMFPNPVGGIACGEGWWQLIETLCENIQWHLDNHPDIEQVVVLQVKEKFGGLRFYYNGGDDVIHGMCMLAESMSVNMCEVCGAPGKQGGSRWVKTLCEQHHKEREEAYKK